MTELQTAHSKLQTSNWRSTHLKFAVLSLPFAVLFCSCVSVDQLPPGSVPGAPAGVTGSTSFGDLDAGSTEIPSTHFKTRGYSETVLRPISASAESLYSKIGNDTGLYNFLGSQTFGLVIFKDQDEYVRKTHQPSSSRAVSAGTSIYTYSSEELEASLAHEMTHLIFNTYMVDRASTFRWLLEGLAMYEELSRMREGERSAFQAELAKNLRLNRMPFSQMTFFTSSSEDHRRTDAWFEQVESVTSFLLTQGSPLAFASMLKELKDGADMDKALGDTYPAKFRNLSDLETQWKNTI